MSSTKGEPTATKLRLASARRRVRAFVDQVAELEASDFPHNDGREALAFIRAELDYYLNEMLTTLPPNLSDQIVDEVCAEISMTVSKYTAILGFILRSTNVRNAFEVQYPLKQLVAQMISPEAKLIMSSEWAFVPFTYPMTLDLLPDFVLVGAPATESSNVLLFPLAGHEIGHSAWKKHDLNSKLQTLVTRAVARAIEGDAEARDRVLKRIAQRRDGGIGDLQNGALATALKQLEEIFCDLFGLFVFGPSYLYAFEYFMAPGGGTRSPFYPCSLDRVAFMMDAAKAWGIACDGGLFDRWRPSGARAGIDRDALSFADKATEEVFPELMKLTFKLLQSTKVEPPREAAVARVVTAFNRGIPDDGDATFPEIVTAGWRYLRAEGGLAADEDRENYHTLGELMLKSIEVAEFRARIADA